MCDSLDLQVEPPIKQFAIASHAWEDFKRNPCDWQKFEALHWVMSVLIAQWHAYAAAMRVNACLADKGTEHDEIVDLAG
jgi:hypothetical protein